MKILLSGYYGFGNVGDEAVLQAIIQGVRERNSQTEIAVLSATPALTKELNQVEAIYRYAWLKILRRMINTDVFVSGGGTLFQNITSRRSFLYYIGLVFLAKLLRKRVMVFAQGFGPLEGRFYRGLARFILNRVNLISLRDSDSYQEIQGLGIKKPKVYVTADPSIVLKVPAEKGQKVLGLEGIRSGKPLLGIALRSVPQKEVEKLFEYLSEAIDWLSQAYNFSPVFILFQCPEDMQETSRIINRMQEKSNVIFRMCRPDEMAGLIFQFDLLIGMRLHSLIFAAMNSVPMLGISYDPKVEAFMKAIDQPFVNIDHPESIKDVLEKIIRNKEDIKKNLQKKKVILQERAKQNFDLLLNL